MSHNPNQAQLATKAETTLYVELDGTLIKTDLLMEALISLLRYKPWLVVVLPFWWLRGRAYFKHAIAERVPIDPSRLPYSDSFLDYLKQQRQKGRLLILATGSPYTYAEAIAQHLGLFDSILSSTHETNLTGARKLHRIKSHANGSAFEYAGNAWVDMPIWHAAQGAVLVNTGRGQKREAQAKATVTQEFNDRGSSSLAIIKELRPHQWLKNSLLLVPLIAGHNIHDLSMLGACLLGIVGFSAAASTGYVFNDLLDIQADRAHPRKRHRPIASGDMQPVVAVFLILLLLITAGVVSMFMPWQFGAVLAAYLLLNTAYSISLKRLVLVDVFILAGLYTLRVLAGAAATGIVVSSWLLAFSMFFFFSLSLVKRYSELATLQSKHGEHQPMGRGYFADDAPFVQNAGLASGYISVLILALYLNSQAVRHLYAHPQWLWGLCLLALYWITRVWMIASRGDMHDDPVVYALTDRISLLTGACAAVLIGIAV